MTEPQRKRITKAQLINSLPRASSIEKHLKDLPLTSNWLEQHAESVEEHQLYRLRYAYKVIKGQHQQIKRWRLLRLANIRKELLTPTIETEILQLQTKGLS